MNDFVTYFITWTTYGTWLPGDARGWRHTTKGDQRPQPRLEAWCQNRMSEKLVTLTASQRAKVETVCHQHAGIRGWHLHAVNARSNHVHLVITADQKPETVRDQFKANATRVLRQGTDAIANEKVWTRGGDCEVIDGEENLERVVMYVLEAQDRKDR